MRYALVILIGIHGVIHLFGFLKAFGISEFNALTQPISKTSGIVWLLATAAFATTLVLLVTKSNYWWLFAMVAVVLSQVLIVMFWKDAKYGTILNLIVLASAIIACSNFYFERKVRAERVKMFDNASLAKQDVLSEQSLAGKPASVQKWLLTSGVVGKAPTHNVYLKQDIQMMMKPGQKNWNEGKANQFFTVDPPAFNWSVSLKMNAFMHVVARDQFDQGKGEMTVKLFSLFPMVHVKDNEKINQAALQRYLAETVWFPSAVLRPYITWEAVDDLSAKATMAFRGTQGSGVFHFDENGSFKKFVALRYKDAEDTEPTLWTVTATKTEARNGIRIPVEAKVDWALENGNWTWLKLIITEIQYDLHTISMANMDSK